MNEPEPEEDVPQESETVQTPERKRRPLPLVIAWGLAPAISLILAGLLMELKPNNAPSAILLFLGVIGGPLALFGWSAWMVYPANWTTPAKVIAVVLIAVVMCAVNLFLAFGACALIDPPFHIQ